MTMHKESAVAPAVALYFLCCAVPCPSPRPEQQLGQTCGGAGERGSGWAWVEWPNLVERGSGWSGWNQAACLTTHWVVVWEAADSGLLLGPGEMDDGRLPCQTAVTSSIGQEWRDAS